jgi:hypothetical protein
MRNVGCTAAPPSCESQQSRCERIAVELRPRYIFVPTLAVLALGQRGFKRGLRVGNLLTQAMIDERDAYRILQAESPDVHTWDECLPLRQQSSLFP